MSFIIDNSIVTGFWNASQTTAYSDAVLDAASRVPPFAPAIWVAEFSNVVRKARLTKLLTEVQAKAVFARIDDLHIVVDTFSPQPARLFALSMQYGLSANDACYLELALRLRIPIACGDGALSAAARKSGVGVFVP